MLFLFLQENAPRFELPINDMGSELAQLYLIACAICAGAALVSLVWRRRERVLSIAPRDRDQ
jgi:hypothetical protein